jgi:putative ABC transport system permease protein
VVLSSGAAADLRSTAGSGLRIAGDRYRVAAVGGDASFGHVPVVWMALADWQRATDAADTATVLARGETDDSDGADRAGVPSGYLSVPLDEARAAIGSFQAENGSLQLIRGLLFAISAMVVGAFFTVWTMQRSRDIAVLKALGASSTYLVRDALGQAALVLTAGIGLGAAVVTGAGLMLPREVPFVLDPRTLGPPLAVLGLLGLAGAAVAVRRITAVDPLAALGSAR